MLLEFPGAFLIHEFNFLFFYEEQANMKKRISNCVIGHQFLKSIFIES